MCTDGAEVLEALAHGGVFFEEQVERLGALVRLCSNEEYFKEAINAKPDIDDEACDVGWCLGGLMMTDCDQCCYFHINITLFYINHNLLQYL